MKIKIKTVLFTKDSQWSLKVIRKCKINKVYVRYITHDSYAISVVPPFNRL